MVLTVVYLVRSVVSFVLQDTGVLLRVLGNALRKIHA